MATRKTGSRRIVVDSTAYRWRVRHRATNLQADYGWGRVHVTVELAEEPGSVLVVYTNHPHPADFASEPCGVVPVLPSHVADWVREAVRAGWVPTESGAQFLLRVTGPSPTRQAELGTAPITS